MLHHAILERSHSIQRGSGRLSTLLLIALGTVLSLSLWQASRQRTLNLADHRLRDVANEQSLAIRDEFLRQTDLLRSLAALCQSSPNLDRQEFTRYARALESERAGLLAIEWVPRVESGEREAFECELFEATGTQSTLRELADNGRLAPAANRGHFFPVLYSLTRDRFKDPMLGVDLASDTVRWETLERCVATGQLAASPPLRLTETLASTADSRSGIFISVPVYTSDVQSEIEGFVVGLLEVSALVESILAQRTALELGFRVCEVGTGGQLREVSSPVGQVDAASSRTVHRARYDLVGQRWQMEGITSSPTEGGIRSLVSLANLLAGLALCVLLSTHCMSLQGSARDVTKLVARRTAEVENANSELAAEIAVRKSAEARVTEHTEHLERANQNLHRVRKDLASLVDELQEKNCELDEFTYVASHDLQEPVRKMISFSELLEKDLGDSLSDDVQRDLNFIIDAAKRMRRLVQDLLLLSRTGRSAMRSHPVPLDDCLDIALDALRLKIEETNAEIVRAPLPTVVGDPTLITQLYQNLISNAIKFSSRDRRPRVELTAQRVDDDWVLGVQDNGIGIEPDFAEKIFKPFQRLHARGEYEGTGIGLSICRKAVNRHGGRIWIESRPGEGVHFKFTWKPELSSAVEETSAADAGVCLTLGDRAE